MDEEKKDINGALDDEILSQIEGLKDLKPGSQEHTAAVNNLATLYKLKNEEMKLKLDWQVKDEQLNQDRTFEDAHIEERKKDRIVNAVLGAAGILGPMLFNGSWLRKCLQFETEGTFTSLISKGFVNQLLRRR